MDDLIFHKVLNTINEHKMLDNCKTVIAGVSGGADSLCLLLLLDEICRRQGIELVAAHVNHMLRAADADADQIFVEEFCFERGIPCRVMKRNVAEYARERKMGIEEAGREVRYGFFQALAEEYGGAKIAVAHNRNDRAETVMMNILRGSGLQGLRGIPYTRDNIIRPLLDVSRQEIEDFLQKQGIRPQLDFSNQENIYCRNKIRNQLFPYIKKEFGIDPVDSLVRLSENASEDSYCLGKISLEHYRKLSHNEGGKIIIPVSGLISLDRALVNRILALAALDLYELSGVKNKKLLERVHIEQLISLVEKGESGRYICLPDGLRVKREFDRLIFFTGEPGADISYEYLLPKPVPDSCREIHIPEAGCRIIFRLSDKIYNKFSQKDYEQAFDYDNISKVSKRTGLPLLVRNRRSGDFILPLKGAGKCKLKKFFIDNKVAADTRNRMPLLAIGNEIVWIPGMRVSANFAATDNSRMVLIVSLVFDNNNQEVAVNEK